MAHHAASCKAVDAAFKADATLAAKKLREMAYAAYMVADHTLHLYYLGGPDLIVGPDAPTRERDVLGVIAKVGSEVGAEVIKHRGYGQKIQELVMGFAVHPMAGIPGGAPFEVAIYDRTGRLVARFHREASLRLQGGSSW